MAVRTTGVIIGAVARVTTREIPKTKDREALHFTNMLIVGNDTLADVTLGRGLEPAAVGTQIVARISVGVYRDDDQITLEEYLDPATVVRELGGSK